VAATSDRKKTMSNLLVDDAGELRSDKQAAFVREYVKDWNATQAAI
jgi:hypothetical protein